MGIQNPFKHTDAPDHMTQERKLRFKHIRQTLMLCLAAGVLGFAFTPLIVFFFVNGQPFSLNTIDYIWQYVTLTLSPNYAMPHIHMLRTRDYIPFSLGMLPNSNDPYLKGVTAYTFVVTLSIFFASLRQLWNPHRKMVFTADASWCDEKTLSQMEERKQIGIKGGFLGTLGIWPTGIRRGQHVKMIETLSALCLAPPGTGKTAGFVIPTLITCPGSSFVVNDSKPELFEMSGGSRAKISNVFMLDWSKVDDPDNDVYYPRFNFLSPKLVPPAGPNRDTFVDSIAKTLIPDKKGGGDSYFTDKGRGALTGFIHLLIAKVNDAKDYDGIPEAWYGQEASLPMLVDWMAAAQFAASTGSAADDTFVGNPDEMEPAQQSQDPMGDWIKSLSTVVNPATKGPAASARAFTELSPLIMMADKERSGVLGTMDQALIPFKNEAVKQRTSACDFTPADLRGIWDPKRPNPSRPKTKEYPQGDHWWPVTLYICVNQAEADAFATITALLYEVMSRYLLSFGANEYDPKSKKLMGPYPICFMLDEFAKLPRIEAVIQGPDLGRSKQLSYWFLAQAYGQIEKKYEKSDIGVINSTTAVKLILSQNDNDTADMIAKMVGDTTIRKGSLSFQDGLSKSAFSWSRSDTVEKVPFLRHADIIGMQPGTHLVLVQNFMNRPMKLNTPMYFKDPEMAALVRARGKGPVASTILPEFAKKARKKLHRQTKNKQIVKNFELTADVQKIGDINIDEYV